jgi:hypothetical protein
MSQALNYKPYVLKSIPKPYAPNPELRPHSVYGWGLKLNVCE